MRCLAMARSRILDTCRSAAMTPSVINCGVFTLLTHGLLQPSCAVDAHVSVCHRRLAPNKKPLAFLGLEVF